MSDPTPRSEPLSALSFLVGTWEGGGHGSYPTISPFDYTEHIEIARTPKPVLRYQQRTASAVDGAPLHAESGWIRFAEGAAEMVVAQATGIVEVHRGTVVGSTVVWQASTVGLSAGASGHRVREVVREVEVAGDRLTYRLHMAAAGQPLQLHLEAQLSRVAEA